MCNCNQLEKLEAARSAYLLLPLVTFPYLWLPFLAFRLTEPYWATGPYCALLGLIGPYWALLGLTLLYWALLGQRQLLSQIMRKIVD